MSFNLFKRLSNTIKLFDKEHYIGVKYSRSKETEKNWGDALNGYLIPRISGKTVLHHSEYFNLGLVPTLGGIGSILDSNRVRNLIVWGSGLKKPTSMIHVKPSRVLAVRGALTRKRLMELGMACPEVYGDAALVLPKFYQPATRIIKYRVGIIPHYIDKDNSQLDFFRQQPDVCIIDVMSGIEEFVDQLCACEVIVSSSLHGLIAADAYGIPRVWMKLSDKIAGGDFKFMDYFSSTDIHEVKSISLLQQDVPALLKEAVRPSRLADMNKLLEVFPS